MNDMINERDKEFANEFSRFVNGKMGSASKVGAEFANDHRFLVNEKFKVMMAFMEQLAVNYKKGYYDPRNEWACTLAHAAIEALREQQLYYPSSPEYSLVCVLINQKNTVKTKKGLCVLYIIECH